MNETIKRLQDTLAEVQTWVESAEKRIKYDTNQIDFWKSQLEQDTAHLAWCKEAAQEWQDWLDEAIAEADEDFESVTFEAGEVVYSGLPAASNEDEFPF